MFKELEYNVSESINCLIIGANIASISNTNFILERALKLALIQYEVGKLCDYSDQKILNEYIGADKKYSGKNMESNIQRCKKVIVRIKQILLKICEGY